MKALHKGRLLRQKYGLTGAVNVEELADVLGLRVDWRHMPADELHEITIGRNIAVSSQANRQERRWAIAHGIGHRILHPGNHVWLRAHTMLAIPNERQAETFAYGLLVDWDSVKGLDLDTVDEVAEYFGVPAERVWTQLRLL